MQIDLAPDMLSLRYPMELNPVGDAVETLRGLMPLLKSRKDGKWRSMIEMNAVGLREEATSHRLCGA